MHPRIFLFFIASITVFFSFSQQLSKIKEISLHSNFLQEDRKLLICTFDSVEDTKNHRPNVYLLDGAVNFYLAAGIVSNLVRAKRIPPVNLIGIPTYDYNREYDLSTPQTSGDAYFQSGGYENFKKFLTEEVINYVETNISPSGYRVLIGHSLGGLFGLKLLVDLPLSYSAGIFADPSIWWNEQEVLNELRGSPLDGKHIYLTRSSRDSASLILFDELEQILKLAKIDRRPLEDHISILTLSIFDGLKFVFEAYPTLEECYAEPDYMTIKQKIIELNQHYQTSILPEVRILAPYARRMTHNDDLDQAIEILTYLKSYHPKSIMVLNFLGEAHQTNGDKDKALKIYSESLEVAQASGSPMVKWIEKRIEEVTK